MADNVGEAAGRNIRGRRSTFQRSNFLEFPGAVGEAPDWSIENNGVGALLFLDLEGANVLGIMLHLDYLLGNVCATVNRCSMLRICRKNVYEQQNVAASWGEMDGSVMPARAYWTWPDPALNRSCNSASQIGLLK